MMSNKSDVLKAIDRAIENNVRFYAYRKPGMQDYVFGAQTMDVESTTGFLVHPFEVTSESKEAFIADQYDADSFLKLDVPERQVELKRINNENTLKSDYIQLAEQTIAKMKTGIFDKIVLSKVVVVKHSIRQWSSVFDKLAEENPDAFVFVYNTSETGAWIGATPERYLSVHQNTVETMALAATRPYGSEDSWSKKEIKEQSLVSDFIRSKFEKLGIAYYMSALYNKNAGNVEHLCNDFIVNSASPAQIEELKSELHPTPAIAGLPRKTAVRYIMEHEKHDRLCYGGYIGSVDASGDVDFFVNLRSMQFDADTCCVYAGGGLTADSVAEDEWTETNIKAKLLLQYI